MHHLLRFVQNNLIVALCRVLHLLSICICGRIMGVIDRYLGRMNCHFRRFDCCCYLLAFLYTLCFPIMVAFNEVSCGWKLLCIRCFLQVRSQKHQHLPKLLLYQTIHTGVGFDENAVHRLSFPLTIPLETHIFKTSLNKFKRLLRHINREFG